VSGWTAKRFWKSSLAEPCEGGFTVRLDARAVKTPAKRALVLPTLAMAEAIAQEWDAQQGVIRPDTMPMTRAANSAIDKVTPLHGAVVDELAGYGGTDLLCYRATGPAPLQQRQAEAWDPLLLWAETTFHAPLNVTQGVMYLPQPEASLARLRAPLAAQSAFHLAGLHDLVAISGSLVLALAVARNHLSADAAFDLSRIDEAWQIEQWGADDEAEAHEAKRREGFCNSARFYGLCG
jgi:chaperone required for assembly of F1-ATPase